MEIYSDRKYAYPMNIEREYINFLKKYNKYLRELTINNIDKIYNNLIEKHSIYKNIRRKKKDDDDGGDYDYSSYSSSDDIDDNIDNDIIIPLMSMISYDVIRNQLGKLYRSINSWTKSDIIREGNNISRKKKEAIKVTSSDLQNNILMASYNINELNEIKNDFISENIELINNLNNDYKIKLKRIIRESIDNNYDKQTLIDNIKKNLNMNMNRCELIAVDQIGKLHGKLNMYYQTKSNIDKYVWCTMRDNRVRPSHAEREGKVYRWDNPPLGGHPGYAIRCRCKAKPVFNV